MTLPLRTLIVDDTVTYRKILSEVVSSISEITLTGTAPNGEIALKKVRLGRPDLIFLDIHMPEMDGIETLKKIQSIDPGIAVVMVSSISSRSTKDTIEALQLGAIDFIRKPDGPDVQKNLEGLRNEIRAVVRLAELRIHTGRLHLPFKTPPVIPEHIHSGKTDHTEIREIPQSFAICVIGVSTGGPEALNKVIPGIPADFPLPILIVQHMPPMFTRSLAESLSKRSCLQVIEASDCDLIKQGTVYIAPGGKHMVVRMHNGSAVIGLNEEPPENSCRPSVDVLFRSAAAHFGDKGVLAVVLTGMGSDGLNGIRMLKRKKCFCITQSASSCIVYGMPRSIDEAGLSDKSLSLENIASAVDSLARKKYHL